MISFDLECNNGHRFEGIFKDYQSYNDQLNNKMINCPICESADVKRLFISCSIQKKSSEKTLINKENPNIFDLLRTVEKYVKENFENVGKDFADTVRSIYYGIEEERNIYGESTIEEIKELKEEGIEVLPLPNIDKHEN